MGIPDLLNFVAREFPNSVARLPSAQEIRVRADRAKLNKNNNNKSSSETDEKSTFSYALVDASNIVQTNGVQTAFELLTQQVTVTHAIFLVADGNRQRSGARRERMMKVFRADKDVDAAMNQLSRQLKAYFEGATNQEEQQQQSGVRRGRDEDEDEEDNNEEATNEKENDVSDDAVISEEEATTKKKNNKKNNTNSKKNNTPIPVIINVGSETYGEGDFKLLHLHRYLTLLSNNVHNHPSQQQQQKQQQQAGKDEKTNTKANNNSNSSGSSLLVSLNPTSGRPEGHIGATPPVDPSFLFVSEDSDLFCGALAGPCPQSVFLATTFHDLMSSLCVLSVGDCAEALARKAGIDLDTPGYLTPQEKAKVMQMVSLDVITLFTILLGNGQCPALAKGATRVDSRTVWTAYNELRWPQNGNNMNNNNQQDEDDYYYGEQQQQDAALAAAVADAAKKKKAAVATPIDEKLGNFLIDVMDPKNEAHKGPSSCLVLNCDLLAKCLTHFHCTDPLAHAPATEQRKLAREYLLAVSRSAFRYSAGTTIDSREENQVQVPSLASLSYVADDALLRFYPFTSTFAFGVNNNTAATNAPQHDQAKKVGSSSSSSPAFQMHAMVPGLRTNNASSSSSSSSSSLTTVAFARPAVKNKDHKYTFGELTKMFVHLSSSLLIKIESNKKKAAVVAPPASSSLSKKQQQQQKSVTASLRQTPEQTKIIPGTKQAQSKFSFELRRMVPTSISSNNNNTQQQQQQKPAPVQVGKKKKGNKNETVENNNGDNNDDEEDFSYWAADVMDETEQKQKKEQEAEARKKKMSAKKKERAVEVEQKALERKKEKNKKKNRKRKDKRAALKEATATASVSNEAQ